ncbi:hypothetical protein RJE46_14895 [Cedecea neteri]|uniref:hypothetical protein n=1 Tax=Cedecea neteri TaxID=158822 RepID=UPI0028929990|nr:hypothetical protein [Cedecea neteri]WNJ77920.1 hypothetical protein RJE46_14895 [Cedecea neteri]
MNNSKEAKIASLNNIQSIINRLADTSSKLKSAYITIVAALLTVVITFILSKPNDEVPQNYKLYTIFVFLILCVSFMLIDSYYLHYERVMRKVYDAKANDKITCCCVEINYFDITGEYTRIKKDGVVKSFPSKSQFLFYGIPFLMILLIVLLFSFK